MLKQLESQLTKIKRDSQQREDEFTKKKQEYEQIISNLQAENQKLRKFIDEQPLTSSPSLGNSPIIELREGDYSPERGSQGVESDMNRAGLNMADVMRENQEMRKELSELTRTYHEQIQQMTLYFSRIKKAYLAKLKQSHGSNHSADLQTRDPHSNFGKIFDKMLRQFGEQRRRYVAKIEQLLAYITSQEEKQEEYQNRIGRMKIDMDILEEQLKIYKRIR